MGDGSNTPEVYQQGESPEVKALQAEPVQSAALKTIIEMKEMPDLTPENSEEFERWTDAEDALRLSEPRDVLDSAVPLIDELRSLPPHALIREYARGMTAVPPGVFPYLIEGIDKVLVDNVTVDPSTDEADLSPEISQELELLLDVLNSRIIQSSVGDDPSAREMRKYSVEFGSTITDWVALGENAFQEGRPLRAAAKKVVASTLKNIGPTDRIFNKTQIFLYGARQHFPDLVQTASSTTSGSK